MIIFFVNKQKIFTCSSLRALLFFFIHFSMNYSQMSTEFIFRMYCWKFIPMTKNMIQYRNIKFLKHVRNIQSNASGAKFHPETPLFSSFSQVQSFKNVHIKWIRPKCQMKNPKFLQYSLLGGVLPKKTKKVNFDISNFLEGVCSCKKTEYNHTFQTLR